MFKPLHHPTLPFSHSLRLLYPFGTCGLAQLAQGLGCGVGDQGIIVIGPGIQELCVAAVFSDISREHSALIFQG